MDPHRGLEDKRTGIVRIIIAGGGTGGHLFPGIAVGKEIISRYSGSEVLFVTGDRKIESDILSNAGFNWATIRVEGIKGRGYIKALKAMLKLPHGFAQSLRIINSFSPHLVLGVGGYSSGPVCLAAKIMGTPTALHEQNSFPGLTNRLLCGIVDRVFISFEKSRKHFPLGTVFLTGNPIRKEFLDLEDESGKAERRFTILVTGGSQGAMAINRAFVCALEILRKKGRDPMVIHHTGKADYNRVRGEYQGKGLSGDVTPFIRDMPEAYSQSDIFVGRAGAGTIFELAALGKPSILIPYPYAANRHQEANADVLAQVGGTEIVLQDDLTPEKLADLLMRYMDDRSALKMMGEQARKVGRQDAAKVIVDRLEEIMVIA